MAAHPQHLRKAGMWPPKSAAGAGADADTYGSMSTLSAETMTGQYLLTVDDYFSQTKELNATGWHIKSISATTRTFAVGRWSCRMCIAYSPDGDPDTAGWICFKLYLEPGGGGGAGAGADVDAAMVRTRYSLLDQAGHPVPSSVTIDRVRTLPSMLGSWTCTRFMKRERFESSSYVKDSRFSVRCDVTVVTMACRLSGVMLPPDLRRHIGDLLATGVGADVTLEVGGEAFPAHRSVLAARSSVFKAELFGAPQKEEDAAATTMTRVRIHDIEPSVFKALLHFIYTDSLPEIHDGGDQTAMARRLLVAAQRYELEGLQWICEDVLGILCPRRAAMQLPSLPDQCAQRQAGFLGRTSGRRRQEDPPGMPASRNLLGLNVMLSSSSTVAKRPDDTFAT